MEYWKHCFDPAWVKTPEQTIKCGNAAYLKVMGFGVPDTPPPDTNFYYIGAFFLLLLVAAAIQAIVTRYRYATG